MNIGNNQHLQSGNTMQFKANHEIDWLGVKILDKEFVGIKRKIREAVHIRRQRPTLNRDEGYELPAILTTCYHVA